MIEATVVLMAGELMKSDIFTIFCCTSGFNSASLG